MKLCLDKCLSMKKGVAVANIGGVAMITIEISGHSRTKAISGTLEKKTLLEILRHSCMPFAE